MLTPRFDWHCDTAGCCVFSGGTAEYDIYMGKCHEHPWDPLVLLIDESGLGYEFENQEEFARHLEEVNDRSADEREALGRALAFVQCFFPTPERWALNELAKGNTE
jgi:hypothetical protein